ncbi:DUF2268 domain-containing protein [Corynebacterium kalidii]|uniref:DUF2268 domain-containing protein n=1 Tax=Corynebacterium kalidii TaxID=2931982 RepID=A0A9X2B294_9CORY|nr:DUF2268 domain-containing putative Zn-dependent protease [Corynebacterium kalidii]MCJ7858899.1 DUF2268 domain-containing protein [Corynebacterium kalidii]
MNDTNDITSNINDINVLDSRRAMTAVLDAPVEARADLVRAMWRPMAGMFRYFPGEVDLADMDRQSMSFAWDGDTADAAYTERVRGAVDLLGDHHAWERARDALRRGVRSLREADPGATVPDLTVLLGVGDPDNPHFMDVVQGLVAFGGISGYIQIHLWPTPTVLDRLEAIVVHELHHNVRYSPGGVVWDPATVTLGEQLVAEGLADVFATELYGARGFTHFVDPSACSDEVLRRVTDAADTTGMENFTAWIHGDASARVFGVEPVGVPTGAGYAVGARLVRAYLGTTGTTAAAGVRTPAAEIIRVARESLGL